ncbi:plant intracellular ras-group-related lrr protein 6, partial [Quercus suber]
MSSFGLFEWLTWLWIEGYFHDGWWPCLIGVGDGGGATGSEGEREGEGWNKIKDWPGAILKSLPNLLCLKLDNNPLRQIPSDGFQAVSRVQVLDLSGNASSLPEHPAFSSMSHLQELYLRRMQLHEVPSDIFNLQQLRILDLSQNSLQSVSVEFQRLTSLSELGLSDNNISVLPPELGLLEPSLQALRLDGNPMRSIRRTILDRGTKAVLNYLKDKIPQ